MRIEERKKVLKEKAFAAFSSVRGSFLTKAGILLTLIMVFSVLIRFYFFNPDQTIWWDASEYVLLAKHMALGTPLSGFVEHREPTMAYIWATFFKIGLGEVGVRLFQLVLSVITVYIVYLIGRDMYDKRVGLVSSFFLAIFYLHIFYTSQLNLFMNAAFFLTLGTYFFWRGYVQKKNVYLYLCMVTMAFGIAVYYSTGFGLISFGIFLLVTKKLSFLKEKRMWIALLLFVVIITPFLIRNVSVYGSPLPLWTANRKAMAEVSDASWLTNWSDYFGLLPQDLYWPMFVLFITGLLSLYKFVLSLDLVVRGKEERFNNDFYVLLWFIIPILAYTWNSIGRGGGFIVPGYILSAYIGVVVMSGRGLIWLYDVVKKHNRILGVVLAVFFVCASGAYQLSHQYQLNAAKIDAFAEIKYAGLWIKDNSNPEDIVITNSVPQNTYYSERESVFDFNDEGEFEKFIGEKHPKYLVISMYESYTPWLRQMGKDAGGNTVLSFPYLNSSLVIGPEGKVAGRNFPDVQKDKFGLRLVQNIGSAFIWKFSYP